MSPNKLYFLYLQGLVHLVSLKILSKSDALILSKILPYSLVRFKIQNLRGSILCLYWSEELQNGIFLSLSDVASHLVLQPTWKDASFLYLYNMLN